MRPHPLQQGEQGSLWCLALDDHRMFVPDTSLVFTPTLSWLEDCGVLPVVESTDLKRGLTVLCPCLMSSRCLCGTRLVVLLKMEGQPECSTPRWPLPMLSELPALEWHQRQYPLRSHSSKQSIFIFFYKFREEFYHNAAFIKWGCMCLGSSWGFWIMNIGNGKEWAIT